MPYKRKSIIKRQHYTNSLMLQKIVISSILFCAIFSLHSQDLHYSMFDLIPTNLSPSETGQFQGDYRLSGIYRNQWRAVTVPFVSTGFNGEWKSIFTALPNLHLGTQITHDISGDSKFRQLFFNLSGAYQWNLGKDSSSILSAGIQLGIHQTSIQYDALTFNTQYNGFSYDPTLPTGEAFNNNSLLSPKLNMGLSFKKNISNKHQLFLTTSWNLFTPQGKYKEVLLGSHLKYSLNNVNNYYPEHIYIGLWSRVKDAFILSIGADYQNVHTRLSYDINYSNFTPATNRRGGFEFGLVYIFKKVPIKHYKRCPDYI